MYKDYEGRQLRRYPEIFDCINVIFVVVQKRLLYKVELNPDRLKLSSKTMINSSRRTTTDFIVDYSILDKQHVLILFNRSIGLVNMVNQQDKWTIDLDAEQTCLMLAPKFKFNEFPVMLIQGNNNQLRVHDLQEAGYNGDPLNLGTIQVLSVMPQKDNQKNLRLLVTDKGVLRILLVNFN
jgi:hypothetical protein